MLTTYQREFSKFKKTFYHNPDGTQNLKSLLELKTLDEVKELINIFFYNIKNLMDNNIIIFGYCGKNFFLNYKSDNNKPISFLKSFTPKEKLKEIIIKIGSYLPILMFYDEEEDCYGAIECIHTKYSLRVIKECYEQKELDEEKFLFIVKPNTEKCLENNYSFILPKILYDKIAFKLKLEIKVLDEKWVELISNDPRDLWLLFKLLHKEASYYITKNMEELFNDNFLPPSFISQK